MIGERILWLDIEATGLDPQQDVILEVAAALADFQQPFVIHPIVNEAVTLVRDERTFNALRNMNPKAKAMHEANGLLAHVLGGGPTVALSVIEETIMRACTYVSDDVRPMLGGFGVKYDHDMIKVHMPRLAPLLHYRHYDMRPVENYFRSQGFAKVTRPSDAKPHRALDDLLEAVQAGTDMAENMRRWVGNEQGGLYGALLAERAAMRSCVQAVVNAGGRVDALLLDSLTRTLAHDKW